MKLNQELLNRIQSEVQKEREPLTQEDWIFKAKILEELWPEVCRRYSEQIIKCDVCEGSGERELYHEVCGHVPVVCEFCEGKGYLEE